MIDSLLQIIKDLPNEAITVVVAALPISELRGAIPLGLLTLKEPFFKTFFLAIAGNIIPVVPLLLFLQPVSEKLRRFRLWRKAFDYLFEKTRRKAQVVEKYEALGLILFVAIPLPVTGAWTACIAASLFKIRFRYAFFSICLGIFIAGIIVSAITLAGKGIWFNLFTAQ